MKLNKKQRATVFAMFSGRCAYCAQELTSTWQADHVEAVIRDGDWVRVDEPGRSHKFVHNGKFHRPENDRFENFYPSCRACNIEKSSGTIEDFREGLRRKVIMLRRDKAAFRHAERFGLVQVIEKPIVFWFETFQQEVGAA